MPVLANFDQGTSDLGRSPSLWNQSRWDEIGEGSNAGFRMYDEFFNVDGWTLTDNTAAGAAATLATISGERGLADLDTGSATAAGEGGNMQYGDALSAMFTCAASTTVYFETRLKVTDMDTGPEFFAGLSIVNTSILAGSAIESTDYIGFGSITDNGVLLFHAEKAGVTVATSTPASLDDGTFIKLGFRVNGLDTIDIFVDGVEKKALQITTGATNTSVLAMTPSIAIATDGTTDSIATIDWVACLKKYQ